MLVRAARWASHHACLRRLDAQRQRGHKVRAQIDGYDRRRAAIHSSGKQRLVETYGKADFYGWSEDKARQYAVPERADFGAFIRRKGFDLR